MKFAQVIAAALAVLLLLTQQVWAVDLSATAAVLMDGGRDKVLMRLNADEKLFPAPDTKIMPLPLVPEALDSGKYPHTAAHRNLRRYAALPPALP